MLTNRQKKNPQKIKIAGAEHKRSASASLALTHSLVSRETRSAPVLLQLLDSSVVTVTASYSSFFSFWILPIFFRNEASSASSSRLRVPVRPEHLPEHHLRPARPTRRWARRSGCSGSGSPSVRPDGREASSGPWHPCPVHLPHSADRRAVHPAVPPDDCSVYSADSCSIHIPHSSTIGLPNCHYSIAICTTQVFESGISELLIRSCF